MKVKIVEKKKGSIELEFDNKELPNVLATSLAKRGVDAYAYGPHPLLSDYRLHVDSKNPIDDLKKSVVEVGKEWGDIQKIFRKTLGKKK